MNVFLEYVEVLCWFGLFLVLPIAAGFGICRALRVREYGSRLAAILFATFLCLLPYAVGIVQRERVGYKNQNDEWVSLAQVVETTDAATGRKTARHAESGETLKMVQVPRADMMSRAGTWVLIDHEEIEVRNALTVDFSRWDQALAFGIDLWGGTNLVYELEDKDQSGDPVQVDNNLMDRMVAAVQRRVNPAGTKEIVVRRVGLNRIEIILPGADQAVVDQIKDQITGLGSLEFAILANRRDHGRLIEQALKSKARKIQVGNDIGIWMPIAPNKDAKGREIPNDEFDDMGDIALRQMARRPKGFKEVLVIFEPDENRRVTGKNLARASATVDSHGRPAVGFHFDAEGGMRFSELTRRNRPRQDQSTRQLAVILDGMVQTAPAIKAVIGRDGIIESGRFTPEDVDRYVAILSTGALPVPIKKTPVSEFTISPTLGIDVQTKGKVALVVAIVAVILFMGVYYLVAGLVANFALMLNLLAIVAIMASVKAVFTLPGLAGLVLSAGMAVDANVLIYERIREELQRGASLRMAIHNGFEKAFSAIFDSNITTILTSVILYMIGTEQVKGFAVSLFIGLFINLLTAVYFSRWIINILERSRLISRLRMLSLIGVTRFDFVGKQNLAIAASLVLIVTGMTAFFMRGQRNYDIDFTGGLSITMQFTEQHEAADVRRRLDQAGMTGNITLEELAPSGEIQKGTFFRLRIANEAGQNIDADAVERQIATAFPDELVRRSMTAGEFIPIPKGAAGADEQEPAEAEEFDEFAGGREVAVRFTDARGTATKASEIVPATFARLLARQLERFTDEQGAPKYQRPDTQFALIGTAGSGAMSSELRAKTFSEIKVRTTPVIAEADLAQALSAIQSTMNGAPVFDEVTSFDSAVAAETKQSAVIAILVSLVAIIGYVWLRFENLIYGLAAVVALTHDVLVTLGCVALASMLAGTPAGSLLLLTDFKINMAMIAAFLTIVGYSLNDTIVIFDRLRELRGKNPNVTKDLINLTVNQTLSRTILTALTVFITVVILYALGGEGIHGFAFCMVVGAVAGTYSTVYIASPLVLAFMNYANRHGALKTAASAKPAAA